MTSRDSQSLAQIIGRRTVGSEGFGKGQQRKSRFIEERGFKIRIHTTTDTGILSNPQPGEAYSYLKDIYCIGYFDISYIS